MLFFKFTLNLEGKIAKVSLILLYIKTYDFPNLLDDIAITDASLFVINNL